MKGWLIVNEYLNTEKFLELRELFISAAGKKDIELAVYTNAEFCLSLETGIVKSRAFDNGNPDFIIFYDKDLSLAHALERMGIRLYNSANAIEICDSKAKSYTALGKSDARINVPKSFIVPFTYENIGIKSDACFAFLDSVESEIDYPMIIKESYSSFGMGVHLAHSRSEAIDLICKHGNRECLLQEYVPTPGIGSRDVRLQMVGDKCVAAMMRSNDSDYRANLTNGGVMSEYTPTEEDIKMACDVMKCLKLDFAGIDIIHDINGRAVFCEANSNAHFKNLYDLTGINAAEAIFDYVGARHREQIMNRL